MPQIADDYFEQLSQEAQLYILRYQVLEYTEMYATYEAAGEVNKAAELRAKIKATIARIENIEAYQRME